jgi:hypothetical protein
MPAKKKNILIFEIRGTATNHNSLVTTNLTGRFSLLRLFPLLASQSFLHPRLSDRYFPVANQDLMKEE